MCTWFSHVYFHWLERPVDQEPKPNVKSQAQTLQEVVLQMLPVAHFFDAPKGLQLPKVLQLFLDGSAAGGFGFATV